MSYSSFVGVIGVGRIKRGTIQKGMMVTVVDKAGGVRKAKVTELYGFMGLEQRPIEQANAGDIIALAGIDPLHISDTVCDPAAPEALPALTVDEPTLMMTFQVNDSPFAGKEGKYITSRQIKARLEKELLHNVALRVEPTEDPDKFKVAGRGELHLSILIENMRREGYELSVSRPEVVYKEVEGVLCEPFEMLLLDIEEQHQGAFMQQLNEAGAEMQDMVPDGKGRIQLCFIAPTRALIGFHSQFMMTTSGTGIMHHVFDHYGPVRSQNLVTRRRGVLITKEPGVATAYSLYNLQPRGELFIGPQTAQYEGMIIGIHARSNDLVVNANKGKQLTNIRAAGSDENIILTPPIKLTLEYALGFIDDDELVEITPASIRLRKKKLKEHERKRSKK